MNVRTPVFVYADDPVSQAGLEQLLRARPEIHVVATGQIDDAHVAVVGSEEIDDDTMRTIPASSATAARTCSSSPRTLDEDGRARGRRGRHARHAAPSRGDAGATRPRSSRQVAAGEASVPTDLVGQLLGAVRRLQRGVPSAAYQRAGHR